MRKDDFAKAMNMKRFGELKAEWKVVGNQDDSPKRRQVETELGKFEKAAAYQDKRHMDIEALAYGRGVLILYKCFLRAKQAAKLGAQVFKEIAAMWPSGPQKGPLQLKHPKLQLVMAILDEYYAQTSSSENLKQIVAGFEQTSQGLSAPSVVIADCLGRERTGPEGSPAEGVVNLRPGAKKALETDIDSLDDAYRLRAANLLKLTGGDQQTLDNHKAADEQYLMMKQLESGNTKSIHIEYSYIAKYSVDAMARIILHESTHKFAATGDFGYADKGQISKLAPTEAVRNADSFAYAGMCLLRDSLVTPGQLNNEKPSALESGGLDSLLNVMIGKGQKAS